MALLSAGLLGQLVRLPRETRFARIGALLAIVAGPLWGLGPWNLPIGVAALAGIVVFALGAWRAGQWGRWAAVALLGSTLGGAAIIGWALTAYGGDRLSVLNPMLLAIVALTPIWLVVGATLQSLPALAEPGDGADGLVGEVVSA
jgi:hypothetical protein